MGKWRRGQVGGLGVGTRRREWGRGGGGGEEEKGMEAWELPSLQFVN